ncbi:hypothetical protein Tco_0002783, partial [Tanacetum coccineum]
MADTRNYGSYCSKHPPGEQTVLSILELRSSGNFLDKIAANVYKNIESKSRFVNTKIKAVVARYTNSSTQAVSSDVAELKDIVRALLLDKKNQASAPAQAPAPVKAVELSCVTCGGAHSHQNCPATHAKFIGKLF